MKAEEKFPELARSLDLHQKTIKIYEMTKDEPSSVPVEVAAKLVKKTNVSINEIQTLFTFWSRHQWKPIEEFDKERLVNDKVLFRDDHHSIVEDWFTVGYWDGDGFSKFHNITGFSTIKPTHFMEIPK